MHDRHGVLHFRSNTVQGADPVDKKTIAYLNSQSESTAMPATIQERSE